MYTNTCVVLTYIFIETILSYENKRKIHSHVSVCDTHTLINILPYHNTH